MPISAWHEVKPPLHILRQKSRKAGNGPCHFLTLIKIPDEQPVALIVGDIEFKKSELVFRALTALPSEDRELLSESFRRIREGPGADLTMPWIARLVLGKALPAGAVKWTKDLRLLERGARNANTKRT